MDQANCRCPGVFTTKQGAATSRPAAHQTFRALSENKSAGKFPGQTGSAEASMACGFFERGGAVAGIGAADHSELTVT
jgi:hypothetical protein